MSGVVMTVRIDAIEARRMFQQLIVISGNTTPVMRAIGVGLRANVHERFQSGVDELGVRWVALNRDYAFAKKGPGILRESGMSGGLMGSIAIRAGLDQVEVGSNKIYAAVHQFGATIRPKSRSHLVFRLGGNRVVFAQSVTIPARPYLGIGPQDMDMIGDVIEGAYMRAMGRTGLRR
jgi:phage virion morphogenesis protein